MPTPAQKIVSAIQSNDAIGAKDLIRSILSQKAIELFEAKKKEVARQIYPLTEASTANKKFNSVWQSNRRKQRAKNKKAIMSKPVPSVKKEAAEEPKKPDAQTKSLKQQLSRIKDEKSKMAQRKVTSPADRKKRRELSRKEAETKARIYSK